VYERDGDDELAALTATPYSSVADAHQGLLDLQDALDARNDRRVIFLSVYTRMTDAVADHIDRGTFENPAWVRSYLVAFANLYRKAVHTYETDRLQDLPDAWQLAFDAANNTDSLVIQDAALGVNAHINYDLALALDRVDVTPDYTMRYRDHARVTDVISAILDDTQDALADRDAPGIAALDHRLGDLDDRVYVFTIDECRDSAWRTATALQSGLRVRRRFARWVNDVTATGVAYLILSSHASDRLHDALHELESTAEPAP
jgi:hypothetical protein